MNFDIEIEDLADLQKFGSSFLLQHRAMDWMILKISPRLTFFQAYVAEVEDFCNPQRCSIVHDSGGVDVFQHFRNLHREIPGEPCKQIMHQSRVTETVSSWGTQSTNYQAWLNAADPHLGIAV